MENNTLIIENMLLNALKKIFLINGFAPIDTISEDFDIFNAIDSFALVDYILEVESELENYTGKYISISDDFTFDSINSPLINWSLWVDYINKCIVQV
jgi:hypothetical protein